MVKHRAAGPGRPALERFRGCLLGLACGDAVGTTVEFCPRGSFAPLTDMVGGGPFRLEAGQWTDDTSMALCLGTSLVKRGGFDPADQMERYCRWVDEGYLSSTGTCFDIGNTVARALAVYRRTGEPFAGATDPRSAGNGCVMRLAPVPMYFHADLAQAVHYAGESSRTTHGAAECIAASRLFGAMLVLALQGAPKEAVLAPVACFGEADADAPWPPSIQAILDQCYAPKPVADIQGTGYVVAALEAALWCFLHTASFEEAILAAANLGDDADTTAAICGQLAGAHYGAEAIPTRWRERLSLRAHIEDLAAALMQGPPA
jgi:ADP-ribosyl-[dinitrogen reductase] hydrolase